MKKSEMAITEKKTRKTGFVVYSLWPIIEGNLKSDVLGGTNPGPLARWPVICTSRTHLSPTLACVRATGFGYKFLRTDFRRRNPIGKAGKSKTLMGELSVLLATKSEPDQVDRGAGAEE